MHLGEERRVRAPDHAADARLDRRRSSPRCARGVVSWMVGVSLKDSSPFTSGRRVVACSARLRPGMPGSRAPRSSIQDRVTALCAHRTGRLGAWMRRPNARARSVELPLRASPPRFAAIVRAGGGIRVSRSSQVAAHVHRHHLRRRERRRVDRDQPPGEAERLPAADDEGDDRRREQGQRRLADAGVLVLSGVGDRAFSAGGDVEIEDEDRVHLGRRVARRAEQVALPRRSGTAPSRSSRWSTATRSAAATTSRTSAT